MPSNRSYVRRNGQWTRITGPDTIVVDSSSSGSFQLSYSTVGINSGTFFPLNNATITQTIWTRLDINSATGTISLVRWFIDGVEQRIGTPDQDAPYTLNVGSGSNTLSSWGTFGSHTVTATVVFADGATQDVNATFTTTDSITPPGPPTISNVNVTPGPSSLFIFWVTNQPATSKVEYGLTNAYGSINENLSLITSHGILIGGLTSNTTYYFRISSKNSSNEETIDIERTSTTTTASGSGRRFSHGRDLTAANTGIAAAGITSNDLTIVTGTQTLAAGQTLYRKWVKGRVDAYGDGCQVIQCLIEGDGNHAVRTPGFSTFAPAHGNFLLEDTTIWPVSVGCVAITPGGGGTFRRLYIRNSQDAWWINGSHPKTFENCMAELGITSGGSHEDVSQSDNGGHNVLIDACKMVGTADPAFPHPTSGYVYVNGNIFWGAGGTGTFSNITVQDTYFAYARDYMIQIASNTTGIVCNGISFINNDFQGFSTAANPDVLSGVPPENLANGVNTWGRGFIAGRWPAADSSPVWTGNRWTTTGELIVLNGMS